jgi:HK97 family phage prohead protease
MKTFERRMTASGLEVRESSDALTLTGYASTFNSPYDMGWYTESVDPGAFKRTLGQTPDVRLLINHAGLPLARTTSGTLTLDTDSLGLRISAELDPADPDVAALAPKMRRGDLSQMSFAFRVMGDDGDAWSKDWTERTLLGLDLNDGDVSVVTYPANPGATAALRDGGHVPADALASVLRSLDARAAAGADIASVLKRALDHFSDAEIIDAQIPDDIESSEVDDAVRAALADRERRMRLLRIAG